MKKALITGITGQDGSYLAELLLEKGYKVYGIIRRSSSFNTGRIDHVFNNPNLELIYGDLSDSSNLNKIIRNILPDEIYNLGAQSHVRVSFDIPEYTANIVALGALRILEIIRNIAEDLGKDIRYYQASSSEMFGKVVESPQNEETPFYPRSPYGVSKVFAYWIVKNYRESYGIHASNGILFNHESPRRGKTFVTRKITRGAADIMAGKLDCLYLGNLDAKRDWGHAKDYVKAQWLILQQDSPDDYVIATGETRSVRDFLLTTFELLGVELESNGKSEVEEEYKIKGTDRVVVKIKEKYFRPAEVDLLLGNPTKAKAQLNWVPEYDFKKLVKEMLECDMRCDDDKSD